MSRRNALPHGLAAETVIDILEDANDYKAFEAVIIADYDARTAVERELVLRLASLLWRIRRATGIESALLRIQRCWGRIGFLRNACVLGAGNRLEIHETLAGLDLSRFRGRASA